MSTHLTAAVLSYYAYPWGPSLNTIKAYLGKARYLTPINHSSLEAFHVIVDRQAQWIVFRGTEPRSLEDWLWDLRWYPRPVGNGVRAHTGFWKGAAALLKKVPLVKEIPILLTGHSLGGGLAVCAAAQLLRQGERPTVITFGCPRVGDRDLAALVGPVHTRYVHGRDVVPRVPPALPKASGSTRLGRLLRREWFVHNGEVIHFEGLELKKLGADVRGLFGSKSDRSGLLGFLVNLKQGMEDHGMAHYLRFVLEQEARDELTNHQPILKFCKKEIER